MAAIFTVRATINPDQEEAYGHWYHNEHIPQLLRYRGAAGAKRYRKLTGSDEYQYMTVYEFESKETLEAFLQSDHFAELIKEYDKSFGAVSTRVRDTYEQVWPY